MTDLQYTKIMNQIYHATVGVSAMIVAYQAMNHGNDHWGIKLLIGIMCILSLVNIIKVKYIKQ